MKVQLHSDPGSWDSFVASHPASTNYHQYGWRKVVEESFGHKAYYFISRTDDGEIFGVLPLAHMKSVLFGSFLVSLPFFNYGGVLFRGRPAWEALIDAAREMSKEIGANHVELRHINRQDGLPTKQHKVTMLLQLNDNVESQWKAFNPKVRNQVRKAEKNGLFALSGGEELLDGFYQVFCRNMRDLGTPVYGKTFFRNILKTFPDTTRIISIDLNGKTIASALLTWYRDVLEVPWASSIRDFRELCPNNLLYWEAMKLAINSGLRTFDFGRSTPGEGTYRFKKQWDARAVPLSWQYLLKEGRQIPELNISNPRFRFMIKTWRRLPVSFTKILGPRLVRCIP